MQYYFISKQNHDGKTLEPLIPKNRMRDEDNKIKRICVSSSIAGCLTAIHILKEGNYVYIHSCESDSVIQPTIKQVPDVQLTGELWIIEPVKMTLISKIKITKKTCFYPNIRNEIGVINYEYKRIKIR